MSRGARILCGIVIFLAGAAGARAVWRGVRSRAEFSVAAIRVAGTGGRIAEEVRALAGVPLGVNTWDVDLLAVRAQVLRHAWVADAEVRRDLPDAILVSVQERRALAALEVHGIPYGVDRRGQVFAPLDADRAQTLPRITGLGDLQTGAARPQATAAGEGTRGGKDEQRDEQEAREARALRMLRRAMALVRVAGRSCRLSEVRIDSVEGLTVLTEELGDVPVQFGWKRWRAKQQRLDAVVDLWAGREGDLERVRLVFRDQVVVRLRPGVPVDSAPGRELSGT